MVLLLAPSLRGHLPWTTVAELRYIGKANVTPERVAHLRQLLSAEDRRRLIEDIRLAPAWMHRHFRVIAQEENVMRNGTPQPSGSTPPDFRSNVDNQ